MKKHVVHPREKQTTTEQFQRNSNSISIKSVVWGCQPHLPQLPRSVSLLLLVFWVASCFCDTLICLASNVHAVNVSHAHLFEPSNSSLFSTLPPTKFPKPTHWIEENPEYVGLGDITMVAKPIIGEHRPDQDAILAYAEGYSLKYYMMFLETLAFAGYTGDVVLAISEHRRVKDYVEDYLQTFHDRYQGNSMGPNLIVYQQLLKCVNKEHPHITRRTSSIFQFCQLDNVYGWKDENGNVKKRALDGREPRVVATIRYEWYWMWTLQYEPHVWIMLIDARDSYFQTNPFHGLPRESSPNSTKPDGLLYFFGENADATRLGKSTKNMKWLKIGYGNEILQALADKPTICSGSTMGEQIALETYLRALINEHDEANVRMTGSDQGFHNFLYYSGKLSGTDTIRRLVVWEQGKGIVNNLGALRVKTLDEWGMYDTETHKVYQWDGVTLSPVVHQWDRDQHLFRYTQKRFRSFYDHYEEYEGNRSVFE